MTLRTAIVGQFRRPHGWLGRLAGWVMRHRPSNRQRNRWTVKLLDLRPGNRVLELGCGPGVAIAACLERVGHGEVVGIDHSATMIAQAGTRLARAIETGRVQLHIGGPAELAALGGGFDKAFLVNVVQFLTDLDAAYSTLFDALAPGGIVATTYQPRHKNPTRADAMGMAERVEAAMRRVGFEGLRTEELPLKPISAVCVLGAKSH